MTNLKYTLVILMLAGGEAFAKTNSQITEWGYLKGNSKGEVFFVKNPRALEPGILVVFEDQTHAKNSCKVTTVVPAVDCPIQNFSFKWGYKNRRPAMVNAKLLTTATDWHRRKNNTKLLNRN